MKDAMREFALAVILFFAFLLLGVSIDARAAEGDLREIKLGAGATQYQIHVPFPATGTKCLRFMDGADGTTLGKTLGCWEMGTGLTITGGDTINAAGSPGPQGDTGPVGATGATGATGPAGTTDYTQLLNVPSTFAPSTHTHPWLQITNTAKLAGIVPAGAWAQLVTENNTGTPTFTARPGQEVLQ